MANNFYVLDEEEFELPPGFRFHPTDEELITHYLSNKVLNSSFAARAIGVVDLNKVEPWDLPKVAKMGKKEWYFFCQKDRKYPTGQRANRATEAGYWKATGKDKEIYKGKALIGMKKTLVFYIGRAPRGEKSDWVMHEYRLHSRFSNFNAPKDPKSEWVLCRIFKKNSGAKKEQSSEPYVDEVKPHMLPPLMDSGEKVAAPIVDTSRRVSCFTNPIHDNVSRNYYHTNSSSSVAPLSSSSWYLNSSTVEPNLAYQEQDQSSILKLLLERNGSSLTMETGGPSGDVNGDMSTAVSYSELLQSPFQDRGNVVDVEAFLNY